MLVPWRVIFHQPIDFLEIFGENSRNQKATEIGGPGHSWFSVPIFGPKDMDIFLAKLKQEIVFQGFLFSAKMFSQSPPTRVSMEVIATSS